MGKNRQATSSSIKQQGRERPQLLYRFTRKAQLFSEHPGKIILQTTPAAGKSSGKDHFGSRVCIVLTGFIVYPRYNPRHG